MLLVKLFSFAVLMGLAVANKWRFGPGVATAAPGAAQRFRTAVIAEFVMICGVLAVTACLTTFFSPE